MGRATDEERKSELISGLRDVRQRILSLASDLLPSQWDEVYLGIWSPREMLAHLAGWDDTNCNAADEVLAGELPTFYKFYDKGWVSYNAMLVQKYTCSGCGDLLLRVRESHEKMIASFGLIPAREIWKDRGIRARGWKVTIGRLLQAELSDEEEHYSQLKAFIEEGKKF